MSIYVRVKGFRAIVVNSMSWYVIAFTTELDNFINVMHRLDKVALLTYESHSNLA